MVRPSNHLSLWLTCPRAVYTLSPTDIQRLFIYRDVCVCVDCAVQTRHNAHERSLRYSPHQNKKHDDSDCNCTCSFSLSIHLYLFSSSSPSFVGRSGYSSSLDRSGRVFYFFYFFFCFVSRCLVTGMITHWHACGESFNP